LFSLSVWDTRFLGKRLCKAGKYTRFLGKRVCKAGTPTRFLGKRVYKAGTPNRFLGKRVCKAGISTPTIIGGIDPPNYQVAVYKFQLSLLLITKRLTHKTIKVCYYYNPP
jgi:hypothetical protein